MSERRAKYGKQKVAPATPATSTFRLPLPVTANHQYEPTLRPNRDGRMVHGKRKSDRYAAWCDDVWFVVQGWEPPKRTPLDVTIDLYIPRHIGRRADISGFVKPIEDAVIGSRADQWIDRELVRRHSTDGEGWAVVTVGVLSALSPTLPDGRNGPKSAPGRRLAQSF